MHLGRIKEDKGKMKIKEINRRLKRQAYQVIIDRLDKNHFEKDLYYLAEIATIKPESLFFDLITLNFKRDNLKNDLLRILIEHTHKNELIALEIYEKSRLIIELIDLEEIFTIIEQIRKLSVENDLIEGLYDFYIAYERYCFSMEIGNGYTEFDLLILAKKAARVAIEKYEKHDDSHGYEFFFDDDLSDKNDNDFKLKKDSIKDYVIESVVNFKSKKVIDGELQELGFDDTEIVNLFEESKKEIQRKSKERSQVFFVVGLVYTLVGIIAILKGEINFKLVWGFGLVGVGLLYTSFMLYKK
ncbi:hypothetical protein [Tenacibaculum halocynthiae]|uniref:hypothetical protein n=1 Tax=Tenacibaculum halocynthiae TaxID=1254437 RepID=UPI003895EF7C